MNKERVLQQHQDVARAMDETSVNTSRKRPIVYSSSEEEEFIPSKCKRFDSVDKENVTNNIVQDQIISISDTSNSASNDNSFAPWSSSLNMNQNSSSSSEDSAFPNKLVSNTHPSSQFSVIKNDYRIKNLDDQINSSVNNIHEDCNATQNQYLTQNKKPTDNLILIKDEIKALSPGPNNKTEKPLPPPDSKDVVALCALLSPLPPSFENCNDTNDLTLSSDKIEIQSTLSSSNDQNELVPSALLNNQNEIIELTPSTNQDKMLCLRPLPSCDDQNVEETALVRLNDQNEEGEAEMAVIVPINEQSEEEDEKASSASVDNENQEEDTTSIVPLNGLNEEDEKASVASLEDQNEEDKASLVPLNDQDEEDEKASLVSSNNHDEQKEEETALSNVNKMIGLDSTNSQYEKQTNIQISNGQFEPSVLCKIECVPDKPEVEALGFSRKDHVKSGQNSEVNFQSTLRSTNHQINNYPQSTPIRNIAIPGCSNEIIAIDGHDPKTAVMNLLMSTGQYNNKRSVEYGEYSRNDLSSSMIDSEVINGDNEDASLEQTHDTSAAMNEFLSTFTEENAGLNLAKLIISLKMDIQELVRKIDNQENILATVVKANELTLEPLFAKSFDERYNLKVPFSNLAEFTIFNENLSRNVRFCNEFITSLTAYIDNHQSYNKNILNMIKKYLSRELTMKFTASKPTGTKMVLKDTMFCSCLLQATKMTMRNGLTPSEHDRLFYKNLGTAVSSAKSWPTNDQSSTSSRYNCS